MKIKLLSSAIEDGIDEAGVVVSRILDLRRNPSKIRRFLERE